MREDGVGYLLGYTGVETENGRFLNNADCDEENIDLITYKCGEEWTFLSGEGQELYQMRSWACNYGCNAESNECCNFVRMEVFCDGTNLYNNTFNDCSEEPIVGVRDCSASNSGDNIYTCTDQTGEAQCSTCGSTICQKYGETRALGYWQASCAEIYDYDENNRWVRGLWSDTEDVVTGEGCP